MWEAVIVFLDLLILLRPLIGSLIGELLCPLLAAAIAALIVGDLGWTHCK